MSARVLACLVLAMALPAGAHAAMEVAMQDDQTIVHGYRNRDLALRQFKAMGGTTVRINLEHRRATAELRNVRVGATRTSLRDYDAAINAIVAHGLKPQLTLIWKRQQDPALTAEWMSNVALHYGRKVPRYSISNEPDLLLEADCNPKVKAQFVRRFRDQITVGGNGRVRARVKTQGGTMILRTACLRYLRGQIYKRIVDEVVSEIHAVSPRAEILAGETSAQPGLEWFARGAQPQEMQIDGWAHHPFQLSDLTPRIPSSTRWGIGNLALLKKTLGVPIYLTEFGYPHPNSSMDKRVLGYRVKPQQIAKALPVAWSLARRGGARQMLQYQWYVKPPWRTEYWETALLESDDGSTTPAYRALRRLIRSWTD
jgi:hypothetical protein